MEKQLTEQKTHAIITYTGFHYFITAKQEIALRTKSRNEKVIICQDKPPISVNNIADVVVLSDYYNRFPDKIPEYKKYEYPKYENQQIRKSKNELKKLMKESFVSAQIKHYGYTRDIADNNFNKYFK